MCFVYYVDMYTMLFYLLEELNNAQYQKNKYSIHMCVLNVHGSD